MEYLNLKVILLLYQFNIIDSLTLTQLFTNAISQCIGLSVKRFPLIIASDGNVVEKTRDIVLQSIIGLHMCRQYIFNAPIKERHVCVGIVTAMMSQQCVWLSFMGSAENIVEGGTVISTFKTNMKKKILQDRLKIKKRKLLEILLNKLQHRGGGGAADFLCYYNQKKINQYQFQCQNTIKNMFCEHKRHQYISFMLRKQDQNYLIINPYIDTFNIPFYNSESWLISTAITIAIASFLFVIFWKFFSICEEKRSLKILSSPIRNGNNTIIDVDCQHL